jgi:hypothetical protein
MFRGLAFRIHRGEAVRTTTRCEELAADRDPRGGRGQGKRDELAAGSDGDGSQNQAATLHQPDDTAAV